MRLREPVYVVDIINYNHLLLLTIKSVIAIANKIVFQHVNVYIRTNIYHFWYSGYLFVK